MNDRARARFPMTADHLNQDRAVLPPMADEDRPSAVLNWLGRCRVGGLRVLTGRVYRRITWSEVLQDVVAVSQQLRSQGLREQLRVGIRAENSYEWVVLDLALLNIGAIPVAFPMAELKEVSNAELARRFHASAMYVGGEVCDPDEPQYVARLDELLRGPSLTPSAFQLPSTGSAAGEQAAFTLAFSSGTAGHLKCLRLSWDACVKLMEAHVAAYPLRRSDRILVVLPLATFQQRYLTYLAIRNDCDVVLSTARHLLRTLRDGRPTIMLGPPNFYELAETRYTNLGNMRRLAMRTASAAAMLIPSSSLRRRARRVVFSSSHGLYGGSVRLMLVGSAPVRPSTLRLFARAGFALYQIYGMTETGFVSWNTPDANRIGSVGKPVYPGTVELADDGQVLIRHGWHLCVGYEGQPPGSPRDVFPADDVVASGDLGEFDQDGYLYLRGRKNNVLVSRGGRKIQIEELETELGGVPAISRVAVFEPSGGAGLAVAAWFDGEEAAAHASLGAYVERLNARLPLDLQVRAATMIRGSLSADSPLLNRNLKLNRDAVKRETEGRLRSL